MKRLTRTFVEMFAVGMLLLPAARASADTGDVAYRKKCSACHGAAGKGDTAMGLKLKAKDLSDPALQAELSDTQIEKFLTDGIPEKKMPAQKDKLTPEEIKAVVQYVRTLKRK